MDSQQHTGAQTIVQRVGFVGRIVAEEDQGGHVSQQSMAIVF